MVAPYDYRREIATQPNRNKLFYLFINSTATYVLAYLTLYTSYQLSTAFIAKSLDIKSVVFYDKIDFRVSQDFWTQTRVIWTFTAGPVVCLVLGIVFFRFYLIYKKSEGYAKFFLLWFYIHAFNLFFGAYVAGVIASNGFHFATNYMGLQRRYEFVIAFLCVVAMFAFGYFATQKFIQLSPSQSLIQRYSRRGFVFTVCVAPWIMGSLILTAFKLPKITPNEVIVYLMIFTIAVPVVVVQRNFQEVTLVRHTKNISPSLPFIILTIVSLILFRLVFNNGYRVGF